MALLWPQALKRWVVDNKKSEFEKALREICLPKPVFVVALNGSDCKSLALFFTDKNRVLWLTDSGWGHRNGTPFINCLNSNTQ